MRLFLGYQKTGTLIFLHKKLKAKKRKPDLSPDFRFFILSHNDMLFYNYNSPFASLLASSLTIDEYFLSS